MEAGSRMAQYRCHIAPVLSRARHQCVIAKAAYNSRESIRDERDGHTKDYTRFGGIEFKGIFAPKDAAPWVQDRAQLWNAVEAREDASNRSESAQLARNIEVNLPCELAPEQRRQMLRDFVREQFVRKGMVADVAIHTAHPHGDERNVHGHILLTMREVAPDGFGKKVREWNDQSLGNGWRKTWADLGARYLEKAGYVQEAQRWSYGYLTKEEQRNEALQRGDLEHAQALEGPAGIHLGPEAAAQERRNKETDRGRQLESLAKEHQERGELKAELAQTERELAEPNTQERSAEKRDMPEPQAKSEQPQARREKPPSPAETPQEARERVEQHAQAFADSIRTDGAIAPTTPSLQTDGLTWWQRAGMRLAIKARDMAQAFWKVKNIFTRRIDRDRGLDL
ncbi:MAG TPA: MobQ family relaxase [Bryobacteraceae bacterium]